jgi:methylmalonyl-CoA mutase N-terminal domain/subunit
MGGSVSAIENGFMQDEIAQSAYEYQRKIENQEKIIVGVNQFTIDKETPIPGFKIDDTIRNIQSTKIAALKANRNPEKVIESLKAITIAASSTQNLMPLVISAVENHCTLGEIADCLRVVFGEYK